LQVVCQRTYKKTGRCAHYLLENEPISRLLAWLISQPLRCASIPLQCPWPSKQDPPWSP
jgi:hypothetical protein